MYIMKVTHAWWNDWWLTEGFASYYEYRSVDDFLPEFNAIERLVTSDIQPALEFDAGSGSVPIHGPNSTHFVENPSAINYNKGAALVNMMRSFMTEEVFKKACNYYLTNRLVGATSALTSKYVVHCLYI
jgi:aminopeptidase N